jgi:hypothetical protein
MEGNSGTNNGVRCSLKRFQKRKNDSGRGGPAPTILIFKGANVPIAISMFT